MKRKIIIGGFAVLAVLVAAFIIFVLATAQHNKIKPLVNPQNYNNNFTFDGVKTDLANSSMFYDNGKLYYSKNIDSTTVHSIDVLNNSETAIHGVSSDFRAFGSYMSYRADLNDPFSDLCVMDTETGFSSSVGYINYPYVVYDNKALYIGDTSRIYSTDLTDGTQELVYDTDYKDILWFSVCGDTLYLIDNDYKKFLITVDLLTYEPIQIIDLGMTDPYITACAFDDKVIFYTLSTFYCIDLESDDLFKLCSAKDVINMTGNDNCLVYTVAKRQESNGVFTIKDSDENGLWKINLYDFSVTKLTDKIYNRIFVCDDDYVFGTRLQEYRLGFLNLRPLTQELYQITLRNGSEYRIR